MDNSKQFINDWYGKYLPTFGNFINFSVRSVEFANHIAGVKKINIDPSATTGYMNDKGEIYLPACYYKKEYYEQVYGLSEDDAIYAAISFHNGAQIHEALHVANTPLACFNKIGDDKLLRFCFNTIEDIYIETIGLENYTNIFNYNRYVNDLYFPTDKLEEILTDLDNKQNLINTIISWKRIENRSRIGEFEQLKPFVVILEQASDSSLGYEKRMQLSEKLANLLKENGVNSSDVDDSDGDKGGLSKELQEAIEKFIKDNYSELKKLAKEIENEYYDLNASHLVEIADNFTELQNHVTFEFKLSKGHRTQLDKRYNSFAKYIQTVRTPKPDYSLVKDRGNDILDRELYRIGIDGNCLTDKTYHSIKRDKPQFIILIDSSGSMREIYEDVVSAAGSIYMSLAMSDIPVSMWGHTGSKYPVIYGIASYKMPFQNKRVETTPNAVERISDANSIRLYQNYDSFAIQSLSEYFTNNRQKFMIVLSDGLPEGYDYGGDSAKEHLKKVVGNCRKNGIAVYSISLTEYVASANDRLYEPKYNIHGYKNLNSEFQKLIKGLI